MAMTSYVSLPLRKKCCALFATGNSAYGTDVLAFTALVDGGGCVTVAPPTCTAAHVSDLPWALHEHHAYHVTVKVQNRAGLVAMATSDPYIHDVELASTGVVLDVLTLVRGI
jgi:hypothetical protein